MDTKELQQRYHLDLTKPYEKFEGDTSDDEPDDLALYNLNMFLHDECWKIRDYLDTIGINADVQHKTYLYNINDKKYLYNYNDDIKDCPTIIQ
jgi:hypothetical protein